MSTVVVEACEHVRAEPEAVLRFVLDLDRYRRADHKIWRVRSQQREGDEVLASLWTRAGIVVLPVRQRLVLTRWRRIDVTNEPSFQDRFARFAGEFVCVPAGEGTDVTHRYRFELRGLGRLVAPVLRWWLGRDITAEVTRLRELVEAS